MSTPPRRPSRPARTPTSRPRRVAGQPPTPDPTEPTDLGTPDFGTPDPGTPDPEPVEGRPVVLDKLGPRAGTSTASGTEASSTDPGPTDPGPTDPGPTDPGTTHTEPVEGPRGRLTAVLVAVIVLLLALGAAELGYLLSGEDEATSGSVSDARPVQVPDLTVRSVVDQAAQAADVILSASSADYDAQVDTAAATMTDPFAEEFRQTKADVKDGFVAAQTEVTIDISAQGVVTASADEVVALLFLTQTTQKGTTGGVTPVQYRVTVTMIRTPDGWLVSSLEAL